MKKTDIKSSLFLFLTAFIWGVAFVAQSVGMDYVGPFTFNAVRSVIGGMALLPCIFFLDKREPKAKKKEEDPKTLLAGGILCGVVLCIASHVHCSRADPGNLPEKKSGRKSLGQRSSGRGRPLPSLYDGNVFFWKRRCTGALLRTDVCRTYLDH